MISLILVLAAQAVPTDMNGVAVEQRTTIETEDAGQELAPEKPLQTTDNRPILWDKVRADMTIAEVRSIYPAKKGKIKHHKNKQTEVEDVVILEGCEAEVEIQHETGVVDVVKVKGKGSIGGRCSDKVLSALSAKYGQPAVVTNRAGSILAREGSTAVWAKDGVTMRFKQNTNGAFGGGGLGASSWEMWYTASASDIAL